MNGIVIIRAPGVLRVIHRAVLSFCILHPQEKLQWMHIGDHLLQGFDVDVAQDDDDETDYVTVATEFFETITSPTYCTQDVTWTWDAEKKSWSHAVAPLAVALDGFIGDDLVGYGSLGR